MQAAGFQAEKAAARDAPGPLDNARSLQQTQGHLTHHLDEIYGLGFVRPSG